MPSTAASSPVTDRASRRQGSLAAWWRRCGLPYLLLAPTALVVIAFLLWPLLSLFYFSMQSTPLGEAPRFVGAGNLTLLLTERHFLQNIVASAKYVVGVLGLSIPLAYLTAILLNNREHEARFLRPLFLLPWVTAPVVSSILYRTMVDVGGPIPTMLKALTGQEWLFLVRSNLSVLTVIVHSAWRSFPFEMLLISAGLTAIPPELYEASRVDGASEWDQFVHITFPLTRNQLFIAILLITIWTLQDSEGVYAITRGGPGYATEMIGVRLFKEAFVYHNTGIAAAIGVILIVLSVAFLVLYMRVLQRGQDQ